MRTVVFAGPSLHLLPSPDLLDGFDVMPSIRRGDLPALLDTGDDTGDDTAPPDRIAIIDGEFGQSLAVSVTEVREAIVAGVEVWGASSMGALRAVECEPLGMRGIGVVYEWYRDGVVDADDEVALLFDRESGQPLTVPLVNVRWSARLAVEEGAVSPAGAAQVVEAARSLHFEERTYRTVEAALSGAGAEAARRIAAHVQADPRRFDRKFLDALALLERLRATIPTEPVDAAV